MTVPLVVAGTGSRSLQLEPNTVKWAVYENVLDKLRELQPNSVISGMAEGFDTCIARAALDLNIELVAAVPNKGYGAYYWKHNSVTGQDRYEDYIKLLNAANRVVYVTGSQLYVAGLHSNFVRNNWMVDHANHFLVYDPKSRGTAHCFKQLKDKGRSYNIITAERTLV